MTEKLRYVECDVCSTKFVGPIFKACTTRPSNPMYLCSVMWACENCAHTIGGHIDDYWENYANENDLLYEG